MVRVKTGIHSEDPTQPEALSPSLPGMFLVDLEYFFVKLGGGFDEMLFSSYYGQENVELAIRVWVGPILSFLSFLYNMRVCMLTLLQLSM